MSMNEIRPFRIDIPQADLASFADDFKSIRWFAERDHKKIVRWTEFDRSGHYAAHQVPDLLIGDVREFFRRLR